MKDKSWKKCKGAEARESRRERHRDIGQKRRGRNPEVKKSARPREGERERESKGE